MVSTSKNALKFGSIAKILHVLTIVVMWILVAAAGLSLVGSIVVGLIPAEKFGTYAEDNVRSLSVPESMRGADDVKQALPSSVTTGTHFAIHLPNGQTVPYPVGSPLKPMIMAICFSVMPLSLICASIAFSLARILRLIAQGRPFEPENGKALCWIALCIPIFYLAEGAISFALIEYLRRAIDLHADNSFSVQLNQVILPSLLLLILSGVFRYGSELQRDADETV
jgi:hypothetical protein